MTHDHTYRHMREASQSDLFDRNSRELWIGTGARYLTERAYERAREILESHGPKPLPKDATETMQWIVHNYEAELGASGN